MKKGIGPRGLGASKSPMKMYGAKSPAKQTMLSTATVVGKKGKGLNETTEIASGNGAEFVAKRTKDRKTGYAAYNTSKNRAPNTPLTPREKSDVHDSVRKSYAKTGVTVKGVRSKSTGKRLSSEQEGAYNKRTNR